VSNKVSSYCLPDRKEVKKYIYQIENIKDDALRKFIKLILLSGFRSGEILNSYLFRDVDNNIYIRAVATKTKEFQLFSELEKINMPRGNHAKFLGRTNLKKLVDKRGIWKSVPLTNLFKISVSELEDLINDEMLKPDVFVAEGLSIFDYNNVYNRLKKEEMRLKVKYRASQKEASVNMYFNPSFHFYRKLFASEYSLQHNHNILKTIDFMKWSKLDMILHYVKDY